MAIAYFLVTYIEYGIFIVIGYVLYALEAHSALQYINSQETDYHLNKLYSKVAGTGGVTVNFNSGKNEQSQHRKH